ncbi:MAG: dihydroorotate dehydrogenase [Gemmatimonadaceae bacterium]
MSSAASPLVIEAAGLRFQNPVILASGTAAYGRELAGVVDLDAIGGLVTKAVSVEPRPGAAAPRVAEWSGGMINAIGLANPGVDRVRGEDLPWLAKNVRGPRVLVNVVGREAEDFASVVETLDGENGFHGFELNVSCPNVKAGGLEFGADEASLRAVVAGCRKATTKPVFVKLSPTLGDIAAAARIAVDSGADGITLVNTLPGLVIDIASRRPALGFGRGGVSGAGLLPVGVLATAKVRKAVGVPIIGVGGVSTATDALQYMIAGASLVGIGTAALRDPRLPERIVRELESWCGRNGIRSVANVIGTLEWPA